ncbi:MAG: ankyrin repeat domain-containing protein [Nitrosomonadales bacterium]|jgi:ankyrin repeat protein
MNQRLLRILGGKTEHYPYALESKYPRILEAIMSLWDDEGIDDYFMELMVSDRGDRAGFPPDIAAEIMHLSLVHAAQEAPDKHRDIWAAASGSFVHFTTNPATEWTDPEQRIKAELSKLSVLCTPEGFFSAAETGNRAAVALFIEANSNIEIRDNRGWTLLMTASFNGHAEIVRLLTGQDADVNALDLGGNSALHWAAFGGHTACAKLLVERHAKINVQNNFGWTPLIQAAARNHPEVVDLLIESGANLDRAANDGYTALHKAAASGYLEIVQALLNQGANRSLKTNEGDSAEKLAFKNKQEEILTLFSA